MTSKAVLLVFACFLLINTKVTSLGGSKYSKPTPTPAPVPQTPTPIVTPPPSLAPPVVKASPPPPPPPPPPPSPPRNIEECTPLCLVRCKNHSRMNICMRACLTCCGRCKCVPPGQSGNYEKCGKCYADMTTRNGKHKCP